MQKTVYEFDRIDAVKQRQYIFQLVEERQLSDIYHSHDFYEIIRLESGSSVGLINGVEHKLSPGDMIFMRPGDAHCFLSQSEGVRLISLSVTSEELDRVLSVFAPEAARLIRDGDIPIVLKLPELPFGLTVHSEAGVTEQDCRTLLVFLLSAVMRAVSKGGGATLPSMLASALEEMKKTDNLREGLIALLRLSHYSQSHLSRLMAESFGMSPKRYINQLRLGRAYNDIILTNRSLEDISESLGFSSFSHFNRIFKERFGLTPAALRRRSGVLTV